MVSSRRRLQQGLLVVLVVSGGLGVGWALLVVNQVLQAAVAETPAIFNQGLHRLETGAPPHWTNQWCGTCHKQAYAEWKTSLHFVAGTNENFQAQCLNAGGGRQQWCFNCHAPTNPAATLMPLHEPRHLERLFEQPPQWLTQGVGCLTCHVRDGQVLVENVTDKAIAAHPVRRSPELGTAEFCAGCHQFNFKDGNLPDYLHGPFQQASLEEFLDFRHADGSETRCHDCHMPAGNHVMPGYDNKMLNRALKLELAARWDRDQAVVSVSVTARDVGHKVPGGEFFRSLTLHTWLTDAGGQLLQEATSEPARPTEKPPPDTPILSRPAGSEWPRIETFSRRSNSFAHDSTSLENPLTDSRLRPDETRQFQYTLRPGAAPVRFPLQIHAELWYHVMHETEAEQFHFSPDAVKSIICSEHLTVDRDAQR
ncbi:MAG: multiheme c-type cytochrome [Planctomycetaceae bacterium]|nr:multiheme c-type cytochrome [Planctomycetaceae bacterium]